MKKSFIVLVVVSFCFALFPKQAFAQTDVGISFGIRPTKAYEDRPETFSYFHHILAPGEVLQDEALVMNDSDSPVALKLYVANGISAQNGGTTFTKHAEVADGTSAWLSPAEMEIYLEPGEETIVPFSISVPADALPGHHVAGLVVEALPTEDEVGSGESEAQFVVSVVRRVGVAVVIEVPGPQIATLEVVGVELTQQSDLGATFAIEISNPGNIYLQSEGSLAIYTPEGAGLVSIPLDLDTVLPGDTAIFWVTSPIHLADSDYTLRVELNYPGGSSIYEKAAAFVRDGQPVENVAEDTFQDPGITEIIPVVAETASVGNDNWKWLVTGIGLTLAVVIISILIIRRRRSRARVEVMQTPYK